MVNVWWRGGEDIDFLLVSTAPSITIGRFRTTYARCALQTSGNTGIALLQNLVAFNQTSFWHSAYCFTPSVNAAADTVIGWLDSTGALRLRIRNTTAAAAGQTWVVETVNGASVVQLGASFSAAVLAAGSLNKLDVSINYAVAGSISVYSNNSAGTAPTQLFTFSGDLTAGSGVIALSYFNLRQPIQGGTYWSEVIVADSDTRSWSLQTLAPVANGNTHNFDVGSPAAANVNEIVLSDTTFDGSDTAGEIDQYTIPALATGSYSILDVAVSVRAQMGFSGPSKLDTGVRSSATDTWSADHSLVTAFANYQDGWGSDPATGLAWAALPTNIGLRSVT